MAPQKSSGNRTNLAVFTTKGKAAQITVHPPRPKSNLAKMTLGTPASQ